MVADKYTDGGLILIKTKEGWRAFLGGFKDKALRNIEESLDKDLPCPERLTGTFAGRSAKLTDEIQDLLVCCLSFEGYRPMRLVDNLQEGNG
jgi:hypothetical protein